MNFLSIDKVFDLQTSKEIIILFKIFLQKRYLHKWNWSKYATIKHNNPERDMMHTLDRQAEQLSLSKVSFKKSINLDWLYPKKTK